MVQREADPDDARRTRIVLTEEGRRIGRGILGEQREVLSKALDSFTDDEARELARLLGKLADNWTK
ncbi:MarR family winged helix-turn-helix transcriptional regulator [Microbacterium sp. A204]|uniref:MarR family winged helix-turn-helix transcriptional regulator n=1 Tax=Microbacterium sp. A204 TaxID=3457321 RepID=UPI003FD1776C